MVTFINNDEIIIGLTGPLGTPMAEVEEQIISFFKKKTYQCTYIKVSSILSKLGNLSYKTTGACRIEYLQNLGDALRTKLECSEILSIGLIDAISRKRKLNIEKHVIVIRSFKHPQEIDLIRKIYGNRFFLIGVFAPLNLRKAHLQKKCPQASEKDLISLIENDRTGKFRHSFMLDGLGLECLSGPSPIHKKESEFTQRIEATFCLADLFLNVFHKEETVWLLKRFLESVLGYPFHTPTMEEVGMSLAKTISLRSSDISRQVGAVIMDEKGNILAEGCNEIPKSGGGCYWATQELDLHPEKDSRDFRFTNASSAQQLTRECCTELAEVINSTQITSQGMFDQEKEQLIFKLEQSRLVRMKLFEHRTVHAEMAALTNAAYKGISIKNKTMYVTTFPCHECAKHLIASGMKEIIYLEPYPKSETLQFWPQEVIDLEKNIEKPANDACISFRSFRGISPSCYHILFSQQTRRLNYIESSVKQKNDCDYTVTEWKTPSSSYLHNINEQTFFSGLPQHVKVFLEEAKKTNI